MEYAIEDAIPSALSDFGRINTRPPPMEIALLASERFHLKPGDRVLRPREIPHSWAFAGGPPGRLLISFAPAGKMEGFFNERENRGIKPGAYTTDASFMRAFGMELVGPPLVVE